MKNTEFTCKTGVEIDQRVRIFYAQIQNLEQTVAYDVRSSSPLTNQGIEERRTLAYFGRCEEACASEQTRRNNCLAE